MSLIVFDWDDTLFPTSIRANISVHQWVLLSLQVEGILLRAQQLGQVLILTNSQPGWVRRMTQAYMPALLPTLSTLPILSAPGLVGDLSSEQWVLKYVVMTLCLEGTTQRLISIGNSTAEEKAAALIEIEYPQLVVQIVKTPTLPANYIEMEMVLAQYVPLLEQLLTLPYGVQANIDLVV